MPELETYISIDIETSGPIPPVFSMLSLGACLVDNPKLHFYEEFKPLNDNYLTEAMEHNDLSFGILKQTGLEPDIAMSEFEKWILNVSQDKKPFMLGFNSPFDWQFINYYFHAFLGRNPLGIATPDIKSYYMGRFKTDFSETSKSRIPKIFLPGNLNQHNALYDAIEQAEIFRRIKEFEGSLTDAYNLSLLLGDLPPDLDDTLLLL